MKVRSRSSSIPTKRSKAKFAPKNARAQWNCARALRELRALGEQRNIDGMARFGIHAKVVYGVAKPKMDELARRIGKNHDLALELWATGVHDARILAGMIDEPGSVSASQMECWVRDFDIEQGRKLCVNLNYHPRKITINKPPSPCPYPVFVSPVSTTVTRSRASLATK